MTLCRYYGLITVADAGVGTMVVYVVRASIANTGSKGRILCIVPNARRSIGAGVTGSGPCCGGINALDVLPRVQQHCLGLVERGSLVVVPFESNTICRAVLRGHLIQ
jgi:hypothetical protein